MLNKHGWWFMGKKRMFMSDMLIISYQNISDNYIFFAWDLFLLPSVSSLSLSLPAVIPGWVRASTVGVWNWYFSQCLHFSYQLLWKNYWIQRTLQYNFSQLDVQSKRFIVLMPEIKLGPLESRTSGSSFLSKCHWKTSFTHEWWLFFPCLSKNCVFTTSLFEYRHIFNNFGGCKSFCGATDTALDLDFRWRLHWVLRPGWIPSLRTLSQWFL